MAAAGDEPLRYVVLGHEGVTPPHFDLMFETAPGSVLATWQSPVWPVDASTVLTRLADHRRDYLSYEGPVSGGRGWVRRVAEGACTIRCPAATWVVDFLQPNRLPTLFMIETSDGQWKAWPGT